MMYNEIMKTKVCAIIAALFIECLLITGCASTDSGKNPQDIQEPELLFLDWQYKGFGQEYPLWAEDVLKEGASETVDIKFGEDLDMLIPHESEETAPDIKAQIWVYIDPYYEEYEERYAYITLRRAQGPQDSQGSQGMEE